MHPKNLSIAHFNYDLPDERIAKFPLEERDRSRLLVYESGKIVSSAYTQLDEFLPAETILVFNNTKVVEARLLFQKATGGVIEIFCLEPDDGYSDLTTSMQQKGKVWWKCLVGGASKWKHGTTLRKVVHQNDKEIALEATIAERLTNPASAGQRSFTALPTPGCGRRGQNTLPNYLCKTGRLCSCPNCRPSFYI
jgi:S-adenosylmethionine:tRNA ribosyltransferase-isomerase